ncbi:MAG: cytochrome bc complex cytochrome b subunit, partial [Planctomycetota bacterium]
MKKRLKNLTPELLRAKAVSWFRERIDPGPVIALAAKKTVPIHRHGWIYLLGGAALFLFGLQVATGALLMLYYQPTEAAAHESVQRIMTEVPYGWLVRSVHVWGANLFISVLCLHFLTTLFSGAYRRPRELTWCSGILMLFVALGFGFSGYLLPWNELSYSATRVGTEIPGTAPFVGEFVVQLLRGGEQVTGDTITRFFAAHVMLAPMAFGLLLGVHLVLIQAQGMSLPLGMTEKEVKDDQPFFAEFALTDSCLWLVLFGVIVTLAVLLPGEVGAKADPLKPAPAGIKPEWYFLFMFKTLKLVPETVGVAFFALVTLFLFLLPFLDRKAARGQRSRGFTAF